MLNYTTTAEYSFKFGFRHQYNNFANTLNNAYSEQFNNAIDKSFFTDANCTTVAPDVIAKIRKVIIDTIETNGQADWTTIAPIINSMLLFSQVGKAARQFPFCTPLSITSALTAAIAASDTMVVICLNRASLFVDSTTYSPTDFSGVTLTRAAPGGGNLGTINPTNAVAAAQAAAVNAAAPIAATLPVTLNSQKLPPYVQDRYNVLTILPKL